MFNPISAPSGCQRGQKAHGLGLAPESVALQGKPSALQLGQEPTHLRAGGGLRRTAQEPRLLLAHQPVDFLDAGRAGGGST